MEVNILKPIIVNNVLSKLYDGMGRAKLMGMAKVLD